MTTPAQRLIGGFVLGAAACAWYCRRNKVETVTKDGKTYRIQTVSAEKANTIARENFNRKVQQMNERPKNDR